MRQTLFTVLLTIMIGTGCGKGSEPRSRAKEPQRMTEGQTEMLKALNRQVSENDEAIRSVFPEETASISSNNKVDKMAELIRTGKCKPRGKRPDPIFDHSWKMEFEVVSDTCPIRLLENWDYDHEARTWKKSVFFQNRSSAYKELNALESMDGSGSLWRKEKNGVVRIEGQLSFKELKINGLGDLTYDVNTNQEYPGLNRGGGRIDMILRLTGQWQYTASIQWSFPDFKPLYKVNGEKVDEKLFLEMFSAYGLVETMYLSLNMR